MSHEEVEKPGDFSVKEFKILLYNHNNNIETGMVKNIKKDALRHPFPLLT